MSHLKLSIVTVEQVAERTLGYGFSNANLLHEALQSLDNLRLAVLGDAVLTMVLCDEWYGQGVAATRSEFS
jgi:hypothetical protein